MLEQPITSREYKIMLQPHRFTGNRQELVRQTHAFWDIFSTVIRDLVPTAGMLDTIDKERLVRFYDTAEHTLNGNSYVFRERVRPDKREVTLKFRHRDRYVSQARDMRDKDGEDEDMKFEQDIKPPIFVSLYSFSNKRKIKPTKKLNKMDDPGRLFPDLPQRLGHDYDEDKALEIVNDFTAYEVVIEGASFQIDDDPVLECECGIVVWYDGEFTETPIVAEFSYKYKEESGDEAFDAAAAQRAYDVFQRLQFDERLQEWVNSAKQTKTAFAYNYAQ
ncbi:MAG: hypothetical protein AAF639_18235 [Chloroflexota bacterium]